MAAPSVDGDGGEAQRSMEEVTKGLAAALVAAQYIPWLKDWLRAPNVWTYTHVYKSAVFKVDAKQPVFYESREDEEEGRPIQPDDPRDGGGHLTIETSSGVEVHYCRAFFSEKVVVFQGKFIKTKPQLQLAYEWRMMTLPLRVTATQSEDAKHATSV
jgi:hypothetical protein